MHNVECWSCGKYASYSCSSNVPRQCCDKEGNHSNIGIGDALWSKVHTIYEQSCGFESGSWNAVIYNSLSVPYCSYIPVSVKLKWNEKWSHSNWPMLYMSIQLLMCMHMKTRSTYVLTPSQIWISVRELYWLISYSELWQINKIKRGKLVKKLLTICWGHSALEERGGRVWIT